MTTTMIGIQFRIFIATFLLVGSVTYIEMYEASVTHKYVRTTVLG